LDALQPVAQPFDISGSMPSKPVPGSWLRRWTNAHKVYAMISTERIAVGVSIVVVIVHDCFLVVCCAGWGLMDFSA
jgi:hypothetical protein